MISLDTLPTEILLFIFEHLQGSFSCLCSLRLTCQRFSIICCGLLRPCFRRKTIIFCRKSMDNLRAVAEHPVFGKSVLKLRLLFLHCVVGGLANAVVKAPEQPPRLRAFYHDQLAFEQSAMKTVNGILYILPNCKALDIRKYSCSSLGCASPDAYLDRHLGSATLPGEIAHLLRKEFQRASQPFMTTLDSIGMNCRHWESIHVEGPIDDLNDAFSARYRHYYSKLLSTVTSFAIRNDYLPKSVRHEDGSEEGEEYVNVYDVSPTWYRQDTNSPSMMPALKSLYGARAMSVLLAKFNLGSSLREIHFDGSSPQDHLFGPRLLERYGMIELLAFHNHSYPNHYFKPLFTYACRHPSLKAIHFTAIGLSQQYKPKTSYSRSCPYEIRKVEWEEAQLDNKEDDNEENDDEDNYDEYDDDVSVVTSITQLEERSWSQLEPQAPYHSPPDYTLRSIGHIDLQSSDALRWDFYCPLAARWGPILDLHIRIEK